MSECALWSSYRVPKELLCSSYLKIPMEIKGLQVLCSNTETSSYHINNFKVMNLAVYSHECVCGRWAISLSHIYHAEIITHLVKAHLQLADQRWHLCWSYHNRIAILECVCGRQPVSPPWTPRCSLLEAQQDGVLHQDCWESQMWYGIQLGKKSKKEIYCTFGKAHGESTCLKMTEKKEKKNTPQT